MKNQSYAHQRIDVANLVAISSRMSMIVLAILASIAAMSYAQVVVAPVSLGVIIGMMVAPAARRLERFGLSPWLSAGLVVIIFLFVIMAAIIGFAVPLSALAGKAPEIWKSLQLQISDWKAVFSSLNDIREKLGQMGGEVNQMKVTVDNGPGVATVVTLAPAYLAEAMLFLVTLYFFLATRDDFRVAVLTLCVSRKLRWRMAHVFRDTERMISRYLFSITAINAGLGASVGTCMWLIGMPSPILWGMLACFLNYIVYVGPATVVILLLAMSLAIHHTTLGILLPPALYLALNFIESQLITTRVLGASTTINPFLIFLALAFWLWLWGPIGGFIAVPSLLIGSAILRNILPALRPARAIPIPPVLYAQPTMD